VAPPMLDIGVLALSPSTAPSTSHLLTVTYNDDTLGKRWAVEAYLFDTANLTGTTQWTFHSNVRCATLPAWVWWVGVRRRAL
jgi:hypothetical protein